MLTASIDTIVKATGADLVHGAGDAVVNGVTIDSRQVPYGGIFFGIRGQRFDGDRFAADALTSGARGVVVSRGYDVAPLLQLAHQRDAAVLVVEDGLAALQALAAHHRRRLSCPVVAVTGSTGKTTTKDLIDAVLSGSLSVVSTAGNNNNEVGVPLTVLRASANTQALVLEMGMRGEGQIAELAAIARPTHGVVTNVGVSHIEVLGSEEAIARAKGELVEAIPESGTVYLNGDDAGSQPLALRAQAPVVRYGLSEACAVRAEHIELDSESRPSFTLVSPKGSMRIEVPAPGRHNVYNALAAIAVALDLGVASEAISEGIAGARLTKGRMQVFTAATGVTVIDDAYNANPASMKAAVETLAKMQADRRRIAILGDMAELGSLAELAHFQIGEQVARDGIDVLVTVGERARRIGDGARAEGMDPDSVRVCATVEEASEVLDDLLEPGDVVLVKASRVMGLERVVEGIVEPRG